MSAVPRASSSLLRIVIDACVLANYAVVNLLFTLVDSDNPPFLPLWSRQILEETYRAHTGAKLKWAPRIAENFRAALLTKFPASLVSDYEKWIPRCTNDEGDRHVLACAIEGKARIILTYNLRDFKDEHLTGWGIRALHPQHYLIELYKCLPAEVLTALKVIALKHSREYGHTITVGDELKTLAPFLPEFSNLVLREWHEAQR